MTVKKQASPSSILSVLVLIYFSLSLAAGDYEATTRQSIVVNKYARYVEGNRGQIFYPPYSTRFSPLQWQLQQATTKQAPSSWQQLQPAPPPTYTGSDHVAVYTSWEQAQLARQQAPPPEQQYTYQAQSPQMFSQQPTHQLTLQQQEQLSILKPALSSIPLSYQQQQQPYQNESPQLFPSERTYQQRQPATVQQEWNPSTRFSPVGWARSANTTARSSYTPSVPSPSASASAASTSQKPPVSVPTFSASSFSSNPIAYFNHQLRSPQAVWQYTTTFSPLAGAVTYNRQQPPPQKETPPKQQQPEKKQQKAEIERSTDTKTDDEKRYPIYKPRVTVNPYEHVWNFTTRFSPYRASNSNQRPSNNYNMVQERRQLAPVSWQLMHASWRSKPVSSQMKPPAKPQFKPPILAFDHHQTKNRETSYNNLVRQAIPPFRTFARGDVWSKKVEAENYTAEITHSPNIVRSPNATYERMAGIAHVSEPTVTTWVPISQSPVILVPKPIIQRSPNVEEINIDSLFGGRLTTKSHVAYSTHPSALKKRDGVPGLPAEPGDIKANNFNITYPFLPPWSPFKASTRMSPLSTDRITTKAAARPTVINPMPTAFTWSWLNRTLSPASSTLMVTYGATTALPIMWRPYEITTLMPNPVLVPTLSNLEQQKPFTPPPRLSPFMPFMTMGFIKTTPPTPASMAGSSYSDPGEKYECGRNIYMERGDTYGINVEDAYVVGGVESKVNEFPWQVRISYRNGFLCGGTIVSSKHILTAAHCVIANTPSSYMIFLGDHNRSIHDQGEQTMGVQKITIHPSYSESTNQHDLAIMETSRDIIFDRVSIRPVCLPDDSMAANIDALSGKAGIISGWGKLRESGEISSVLQKGVVPILPQSECVKNYRTTTFSDDMMCAGNNGYTDTCQGDSGGPLVIQSQTDGRYYLQGVTSWGYGCARPNYPGVYARIVASLDWINSATA